MYACSTVDESFFSTAKARGEVTREMAVSARQLFATFEDDLAWSKWVPVIKRIDWTSPAPRGPGATRVATLSLGIKLDEEFWAWEPGRHMGFRIKASNLPLLGALIESYEITPLEANRCALRWRMAMAFKGPGNVVEKYMRRSLPLGMNQVLAKLEQVALQLPGPRDARAEQPA